MTECDAEEGGGGACVDELRTSFHITDCTWHLCKRTGGSGSQYGGGGVLLLGNREIEDTAIFFSCYFDENTDKGNKDTGHDIFNKDGKDFWSDTSPFDMDTCKSTTDSKRAHPKSLAGYKDCTWLPGPCPPHRPLAKNGKSCPNIPLIVGLSVGLGVGFIVIIVVTIWICMYCPCSCPEDGCRSSYSLRHKIRRH
jgi:hypothetical protein